MEIYTPMESDFGFLEHGLMITRPDNIRGSVSEYHNYMYSIAYCHTHIAIHICIGLEIYSPNQYTYFVMKYMHVHYTTA